LPRTVGKSLIIRHIDKLSFRREYARLSQDC
jgi:hypothetical protein